MYYRDELGNWEEIILEPSGDTYPIGMYGWFAGEKAPTNWLRCDGQEISRTEYKELFNAIGTTYGVGDGSTTFNLPNVNLGNRTLVGSSGDGEFSLGNTGGEKEHTLTIDEMPKHVHKQKTTNQSGSQTDGYAMTGNYNLFNTNTPTETAGGSQPHNNMQPYMSAVCCIKAKQSVGLVGNVVSDMNAQGDNDVAPTKVIKEYVDKKQTYSTDEIVVGTYNNKPLYRKIISGKLPTGSGTNNFTITNGVITKYDGLVKSSYGSWFPLNIYYTSDTTYNISSFCNASRNNLYVVCGSQYNTNSDYEITIEYTKITD